MPLAMNLGTGSESSDTRVHHAKGNAGQFHIANSWMFSGHTWLELVGAWTMPKSELRRDARWDARWDAMERRCWAWRLRRLALALCTADSASELKYQMLHDPTLERLPDSEADDILGQPVVCMDGGVLQRGRVLSSGVRSGIGQLLYWTRRNPTSQLNG